MKFRQLRPETLEVVTELFYLYDLYWLAIKSERNSVYYVTMRMNETGTCDYHVTRVWPSVLQSKVMQTSQVMADSWLFVLKEAFKAKEF